MTYIELLLSFHRAELVRFRCQAPPHFRGPGGFRASPLGTKKPSVRITLLGRKRCACYDFAMNGTLLPVTEKTRSIKKLPCIRLRPLCTTPSILLSWPWQRKSLALNVPKSACPGIASLSVLRSHDLFGPLSASCSRRPILFTT